MRILFSNFEERFLMNDIIDQKLLTEEEINTKPVAIKFGIIASFVAILTSVLLFILDLEYSGLWKYLPIFFMAGIIFIAQQQLVKTNAPHIFTLGSLFKFGFIIALITAVAMLIYFIIYTNIIAPDYMDKILAVTRLELENKGLSEDQIETALNMSKKFMSPVLMMIIGFISNLILGSLAALFGALIFRNEK